MNTITINQIKEALAPLADKIGQGAEFTWEAVLRQQYIDGGMGVFLTVFGIAILYITYRVVLYANKKLKENSWSDWEIVRVLVIIFGVTIGLLCLGFGFEQAINHLLNPEYQAIMDLIGTVR